MSDCGCKDQTQKPGATHCAPAELCRNHYYTGKLLTARDFQLEQSYVRDKLRLHHLALHGWGVVCGLQITPHDNPNCHRIILDAGLAIDPCGREVRVPCKREYELPKPPKRTDTPKPCSGDSDEPSTPKQQEPPPFHANDPAYRVVSKKEREHPDDPDKTDDVGDNCPDRPEAIDLHLCLSYKECLEEYSPAPFDECNCTGAKDQPNRICEGYELIIHLEKPDWWDKAIPEGCGDADCTVLWKQGRECRFPAAYPCIPLAVIHRYVPGETLTAEQIENTASKLLLPSTALIKQVIDCILGKLPLKDYTVIDHINWTHGQDYSCNDFARIFVGEKAQEAFEIRFSRPLHPDGVSKRSFQLMIVYRDKPSVPRQMHIAPTEVRLSEDRRTVRLEIDQTYAREYLERHRFDLYIRIYCDKLIDDDGNPVDGNLLARKMPDDKYLVSPPTGNGAPGGIFDSWILVR